MENTVSKPVESTESVQKLLSSSSWLRNSLKSFENVNSILSVTYEGKNLLVRVYSVSFSVLSPACFNVFVRTTLELNLEWDHLYGNWKPN